MCVRDVCASVCKEMFVRATLLTLFSTSLFQLYHSSQTGCVPRSCRRHSEPQKLTPSCDVSLPKLNVVSPSNTVTMAAEPNSNRVTSKRKPLWPRLSSKELASFKQLCSSCQLAFLRFISMFMLKGNVNPQENVEKGENFKIVGHARAQAY